MPSRTPEPQRPVTAAAPDPAGVGTLNLRWSERFVAELSRSGMRDVCICSGSRSAPLALAFHHSGMRTHVPLDERAGAYFALGLAKGGRRPVAVLTTSGTAAANLFPAIVEAFHARVPLIVVTADRPPELRDTGAGQTIDQVKLFGDLVRWFCEVGVPGPEPELMGYVGSLGARAMAEAWGPPSGPVHLNFAFREPLVPDPDLESLDGSDAGRSAGPDTGRSAAPPGETPHPTEVPAPAPRTVARIARTLRSLRRGLLVAGPDDAPEELGEALARLAAVSGYPVLADPASQVRYGTHDRSRVHGAYDAFLRAPGFASRHAPELIVQFGAAPTSKAFQLYAARHPEALHLLVDSAGEWRSPARRAREVVTADPTAFARALAESLGATADRLPSWGEAFSRAERASRDAIDRHLARSRGLSEGAAFADLIPCLPDGGTLYVGNSMAIRDLDLHVPAGGRRIRVLANRGANGIDGLVSSALGASAAVRGPLLLVTGDLSFHHDLTGLHAARGDAVRATIVVIHNDGGGIFSFLPVARHGDSFERYFATPHGLDFAHAAALYGIPFERVESREELRERAASSLERRAMEILEVRTDRDQNFDRHRELWDAVIEAVDGSAA
jgi:2-succinyl-5-enolpyruvyl-6-hydroxy-3-cyclohexene-1-carboxylate synthase